MTLFITFRPVRVWALCFNVTVNKGLVSCLWARRLVRIAAPRGCSCRGYKLEFDMCVALEYETA